MSTNPIMDDVVRERILSDPDVLLEDQDIMRALVAANERGMGQNIVDLRGIAMERLEARLDRLEETHRTVIAAAYENLAGTNQVHRAVLRLLEPHRFEDFLKSLEGEVADILRVDCLALVLETEQPDGADKVLSKLGPALKVKPKGFVREYQTGGRGGAGRTVVLRQVEPADGSLYGAAGNYIRSEACIRLDLGEGRLPGLLVMGSEDPHLFTPQHGTDLLSFFGGVFERTMRRWLS